MTRLIANTPIRNAYRLGVSALTLGLALVAAPVAAQSLLEIWQEAQKNEPGFRAAQKEQMIADALRQQSQTIWQPTVFAQASAGLLNRYGVTRDAEFSAPGFSAQGASFRTEQPLAVQGQAGLIASQPLIDPVRTAQARQLALSADAVALSQDLARQRLLLQVVERSLALTEHREQRRLTEQQEQALAQAYEEIRKRQRLGDATPTDVSEAFEKLQSVRAGLAGINALIQVKALAVEDLLGRPSTPLRLRPHAGRDDMALESLEASLRQMNLAHPQLRLLDLQAQIAEMQSRTFLEGQAAATLSAVARAGYQMSTGRSLFPMGQQAAEHFVGLELSVPLSTGGFRAAQSRESLARADHVVALREQTRLSLEQSIRALWFHLESSKDRLVALDKAFTASQTRLEATRKSHALGMRSTLELLGAETDRVTAERAVFQERLGRVMNQARLAAAIGVLSEADLLRIDQLVTQ